MSEFIALQRGFLLLLRSSDSFSMQSATRTSMHLLHEGETANVVGRGCTTTKFVVTDAQNQMMHGRLFDRPLFFIVIGLI